MTAVRTFSKAMLIPLLLVVLAMGSVPVQGDEDADRQIRRWVRQLDADQFVQRQEAAEKLAEVGKEAIPTIEQAALTGSGEVASRTIDILKQYALSSDQETASLAQSSLTRLAASGNKTAAYLAEQAQAELKQALGPHRRGEFNPLREELPLGGMNRSVRISTVNGDKTIDVTQDGERVVVEKLASGKVSVTWHLGDGQKRTVAADSPEKLQEEDKEAFAKYEELAQLAEAGPVPFRGGLGGRFFMRGEVPGPAGADDLLDPFGHLDQQLQEMQARHAEIIAEMEAMMAPQPFQPRFVIPPPLGIPGEAMDAEAKRLETLKRRLRATLERLNQGQPVDLDEQELDRLERSLDQLEQRLEAEF